MLALIIIRAKQSINYQIYKLYPKKTSLQLSAKISTSQVFTLRAEPESAMLEQLLERI